MENTINKELLEDIINGKKHGQFELSDGLLVNSSCLSRSGDIKNGKPYRLTIDKESVGIGENGKVYYKVNHACDIINFRNVIIDATNLNPKTLNKWTNLATELSADIEYKSFYIPFFEALERDKKRGENGGVSVGKKVLEKFYKTYYKQKQTSIFNWCFKRV